jgi:hypothetical protein
MDAVPTAWGTFVGSCKGGAAPERRDKGSRVGVGPSFSTSAAALAKEVVAVVETCKAEGVAS